MIFKKSVLTKRKMTIGQCSMHAEEMHFPHFWTDSANAKSEALDAGGKFLFNSRRKFSGQMVY